MLTTERCCSVNGNLENVEQRLKCHENICRDMFRGLPQLEISDMAVPQRGRAANIRLQLEAADL